MGELTAGSWAGVRVLEDEEYGNGALAGPGTVGTERISVAGDRKVRHTRQAERMKEGPERTVRPRAPIPRTGNGLSRVHSWSTQL